MLIDINFLSIVAGLLALATGYLLRISNKIQDRNDEIYLKFLPSLNYNISSYNLTKEIYQKDYQLSSGLPKFIEKIKIINTKLEEQLYSGEIQEFEENFRNILLPFSSDLKKFQSKLEEVGNNDATNRMLENSFRQKTDFQGINLNQLLEEANNALDIIKQKRKRYEKYPYLLIITFVMSVIAFIASSIK